MPALCKPYFSSKHPSRTYTFDLFGQLTQLPAPSSQWSKYSVGATQVGAPPVLGRLGADPMPRTSSGAAWSCGPAFVLLVLLPLPVPRCLLVVLLVPPPYAVPA